MNVSSVATIGCWPRAIDEPLENPYPGEFMLALVLLLTAFAAWRMVRPQPRRWLRFFMCGAGFVAVFGMICTGCTGMPMPCDPRPILLLIVKAALFIAGGLFFEIAWSSPHQIARAIALRRTTSAARKRASACNDRLPRSSD
jgi:hypothetical protein